MSEHNEIKIFYEDIQSNTVYDLGALPVSADDIMDFERQFIGRSGYASPPSSPIRAPRVMINALTMRLFATAFLKNTSAMGAPGLESVEWSNDLCAGDAVFGRVAIVGKRRSARRPDMGLISIAIDMRNQHDVLLMRQMNIVMFGCRSIAGEAAGEEHHKRAQFPATQHINMQHVSDPDPAPISILSARPIDDARAQGWESGVSYALGSYEFKRDEMVDFAQKFDPQPFHLSDEAAAKTHFGALAASGWQTASAFFRCLDAADKMLSPSSQDMAQRTSLGFYHLKWIKPVFAGDHVDFYAKIISREQHTDNICLELMRVSGYKQNSELCFDVYYYSRLTKSC